MATGMFKGPDYAGWGMLSHAQNLRHERAVLPSGESRLCGFVSLS